MTDLRLSVASIMLDAGISEPMASSLADRIIRECFRWRPIEEAEPRIRDTEPPAFGEHVIQLSYTYTDRDAETLILLFWDQDEHRWSKWMLIPPPQDEP